MKKSTFETAIDDAIQNNKVFSIITNIAVGHGINGVDFTEFISYKKRRNVHAIWPRLEFEHTKVIETTEDYVKLEIFYHSEYETHNPKDYEERRKYYYIPLENIIAIILE